MKDAVYIPVIPNKIKNMYIRITQAIQHWTESPLARFEHNWTTTGTSALLRKEQAYSTYKIIEAALCYMLHNFCPQ